MIDGEIVQGKKYMTDIAIRKVRKPCGGVSKNWLTEITCRTFSTCTRLRVSEIMYD